MSGVSFAQPDITLHLDDQGVIREAFVSNGIRGEGVDGWVGRPWLETVSGGGERVQGMLADVRSSGVSAFRRVVQRFPSGRELPIEYTMVLAPGERGGLLALGRNLEAVAELQSRLSAAQQAAERESWKLRDLETRYRLLFDDSREVMLIVGGKSLQILDANAAAVQSLGLLPGRHFPDGLIARERDAALSMLQRVREQGRAPGLVLHLGPAMAPWAVRASLVTAEPELRYVLHLAPAGALQAQSAAERLPMDELIERLPDGFAVIGPEGIVLHANQSFLDLVQAGALGVVRGERLGRWLSQPGADAAVLLATLQRDQTVRLFRTTLYGELGIETPVEISAAATGQGHLRFFGVLLRDVARQAANDDRPALGSVPVPAALGRSLFEVVRAAAEAVERRMIGEALERVGGNRTAAAALLGISRQSLHTKLNRYGAAEDGDPSAAAD